MSGITLSIASKVCVQIDCGSTLGVFGTVDAVLGRMHVLQLAELAAVMSQHGSAIVYRHATVPPEAVNAYWLASRGRLELWHQALARLSRARASGNYYRMRCWWQEHTGVVEEVLVSEMLTRVIAAIAEGADRSAGRDEFSPIAQAIYLSHLEARNRVQSAILDRRGCNVSDAVRLNRVRGMVERWIDVLIGNLTAHDPQLMRFGVDQHRTQEHAADHRSSPTGAARHAIACLTKASMIESLKAKLASEASLPSANRAVADSVMMILRPELYDSVGALKSLWMHRIENQTHQTDLMIDEFLRHDVDTEESISPFELIHAAALAQWFR